MVFSRSSAPPASAALLALWPALMPASAAAQTERLLGDLIPGPAPGGFFDFHPFGGDMLIRVTPPGNAPNLLWRTDGTATGTTQIVGPAIDHVVVFAGRAVGMGPGFPATELSVIDPVTSTAATIATFSRFWDVEDGAALGDLWFFAADDGVTGTEPWVTDGTATGTRRLADIAPLNDSSFPIHFTRVGDLVYFFGIDPARGLRALYSSDGATTTLVSVVDVGAIRAIASAGGKLYYSQEGAARGTTIDCFDPLLGGPPVALVTPSRLARRAGTQLVPFGDHMLFSVDFGIGNVEPAISDGTRSGTRLLADLEPGGVGSDPEFLGATIRGFALFTATVGGLRRVFATDGTGVGTRQIGQEGAHGLTSDLRPFASIGRDGYLLQSHDPAIGRTRIVALAVNGAPPAHVQTVERVGAVHKGLLYHLRLISSPGLEPWVSDLAPLAIPRGPACGVAPESPSLEATLPRLGQVVTLTAEQAAPGRFGALVFGALSGPPTPLGGGCASLLDPATLSVVQPFVVPPTGVWQWALPLPMFAPLQGLTFGAQAWFGPAATPSGVELSNGLELTLGV